MVIPMELVVATVAVIARVRSRQTRSFRCSTLTSNAKTHRGLLSAEGKLSCLRTKK